MKKFILLTAILALSFGALSCGGGGAGSANLPPGENPGIPSVVQLTPSHFVAQTNSNITFHAKVLDGNGAPLKGVTVTFTNLSEPFGTLKSALRKMGLMSPIAALSATTAVTDGSGIATVNLFSSTAGFATIVSQVNVGVSNVRDRKTVIFVSSDSFNLAPTLTLDVSKDGITFNQPGDFTLFKTAGDNQRIIRATVRDRFGLLVSGASVTFSSDASSGVTFSPVTATTDNNGQAFTLVTVSPTVITDVTTVLNITATATLPNGTKASNVLSLFLSPVTISPGPPSGLSSVTAVPTIVPTGGTSNVTATVFTNVGTPAPDGTSVNFTTAPKTASDPSPCGSITPFAQTTGGVTSPPAIFTAPLVPGICTVTGKVGGVTIGSVDITVNTALSVQPTTQTVNGIAGGRAIFTIFGGVPSYTITSDHPAFPPVPATVTATGGTFTVAVPPNTPTTTVNYTIRDATGATVTATVNIAGQALAVLPGVLTIDGVTGGPATFTIFGGMPPYSVIPNNPVFGTPTPTSVLCGGAVQCGATFTITVPPDTRPISVTYTVVDATGAKVTVTLNVVANIVGLTVLPSSQTVTPGNIATFNVLGGLPPYQVVSDTLAYQPAPVAPFPSSPGAFTVTVPVNAGAQTVIFTITDAAGAQVPATLKIATTIPDFYLLPSEATIPVGGSITFQIVGGAPDSVVGFFITVDNPSAVDITYDATIDPRSFTASGLASGSVKITVVDKNGLQTTGTLTIQ